MKVFVTILITSLSIQSLGQQPAEYYGLVVPRSADTCAFVVSAQGGEDATLSQPSGWTIDDQAMAGFSEDYRTACSLYVGAAVELLGSKGTIPTRMFHELAPNPNRGELLLSRDYDGYFPHTVRIQKSFPVNVALRLLPEPLVIERSGFRPPDVRERAKQQRHKLPDDWRVYDDGWREAFYGTSYAIAKPEYEDWGLIRPPYPQGYKDYDFKGPDGGYMTYHCRTVEDFSFQDFVEFPAGWSEHYRPHFVFIGCTAVFQVQRENKILRWVLLNDLKATDLRTWLAYALVDGNGAYTVLKRPPDTVPRTFDRPLDAPFYPKLVVTDGVEFLWNNAPREHNLLRVAVPREQFSEGSVPREYEDWTITAEYYAEHGVPAWTLWADKDSQPYREHFYLRHALEPVEHELWMIVIFTHIKPRDLVAVLATAKGIPSDQWPSDDEIETGLGEHYRKLRSVIESLTPPQK
ncbi:MAG TPA: hypothetical protein PKD54_12940 [Pirellulaceae bacterium]|nr:hypothetical protein [Pirellulaceae bacterium]